MLKGENITLRPVREADLDTLRELDLDLDSRGDYWPMSIMSETAYRQEYQHTGFWGENFGRLLMVEKKGTIIGEIMYFKTVMYMDELEIGTMRGCMFHRGEHHDMELYAITRADLAAA
jgi:hypothetical protein